MGEKRDILSMSLPELQETLTAAGQPKFRAAQVYHWLHQKAGAELFGDDGHTVQTAGRIGCAVLYKKSIYCQKACIFCG